MRLSRRADCSGYKVQKKITQNGTLKSSIMACTMETKIQSLPQYLVITGNVVSMVDAPPQLIGMSGPKYFASKGVSSNVMSSRAILLISAIVPSSGS